MDSGAFFAIVFFLVIPALAIYFGRKWYKLRAEVKQISDEKSMLAENVKSLSTQAEEYKKQIDHLQAESDRLSPYRQVADAHEEARAILEKASAEARAILDDASKTSSEKKEQSEATLNAALKKADQIVSEANAKAEEIAGSALEAKRNAEEYKRIETAMKNTVKGYGNTYLIPNVSLLDDLAEEFSHTDAGNTLKEARAYTKFLIKEDKAALCDYVETERRETAVRFVTDAFNGKVDSILSKTKHDNYGTMKQQIEDAFALVNKNGKPFRNARITAEYLASRLEELKWAVRTHELKKLEQEEQRQIREQMREEERARREYEKAIAEAEKEEKMLQKAMAEARKHLESASQEERERYEQQLSELQDKLTAAEEKNQRAISMAQQTRSGHVYVISNIGSFGEDVFKIGMTRRLEPMDRVNELGDASVPFSFDVHAMIYSENAPTLEKTLHKKFIDNQINKVNPRKEFFNLGITDIKKAVEEMDIEVHWTMVAEAREYHESKALRHPVEFIEEAYEDLDE